MPRILVSASFPESQLARQLPPDHRWDEFEFVFNPTEEPIDGWVIYDDLQHPIEQQCPARNTLLITGEPSGIRRYRRRFTSQFGQVWTAQTGLKHCHVSYRNEGQPWHYAQQSGACHGRALNFDELCALNRPHKPKLLSVICSAKTITRDHRQRLEFVRFLQAELGDQIDVFGRDIRSLNDKSDAIWPYKYHIVLENDHSDHYMTEKLTDAYLGWSYPIYFGGSEAYHRFPEGSFNSIDIYQPEQALKIIHECISSHIYEASFNQVAAAREAVLYKNNLFSMLATYWRSHLYAQRATKVRLLPKSHRSSLIFRQLGRTISNPLSQNAA